MPYRLEWSDVLLVSISLGSIFIPINVLFIMVQSLTDLTRPQVISETNTRAYYKIMAKSHTQIPVTKIKRQIESRLNNFHTLHISVHLAHQCIPPCTSVYTLHISVYLAHQSIPCTSVYTLHTSVYLAHQCIPCTSVYTLHISVHLARQFIPCTLQDISC